MTQGRPTGIKLRDIYGHSGLSLGRNVEFEGQRGEIISHGADTRGSLETLDLGFGHYNLRLYGYFSGDEFMEVRRNRF